MNREFFFLVSAAALLVAVACSPNFDALSRGGAAGGHGNAGSGGKAHVGSAGASARTGAGGAGESGAVGSEGASAGTEAGGSGNGAGAGQSAGNAGTSGSAGTSGNGGAQTTAGSAGLGGLGGTPLGVPCGKDDYAFPFGTGISVTVPRSIQDDFTIEAWLKTTSSNPGQYFWNGIPIAWADTPVEGNDFAVSVLNGKLVMNIGQPDIQVASISDVATGSWVHVAMTRSKVSGIFRLFVNGVLEASGLAHTLPLNAVPTIFLGSTMTNDVFLVGEMDELRLWETVRTAAELQAGMHQRLRGDEAGLVGYYRFDQLAGLTLPDSSSKGNNGSVSRAVQLVESSAPSCTEPIGAAGQAGAAEAGGMAGAG